jgi:hypothetical protein
VLAAVCLMIPFLWNLTPCKQLNGVWFSEEYSVLIFKGLMCQRSVLSDLYAFEVDFSSFLLNVYLLPNDLASYLHESSLENVGFIGRRIL